VLLTAAAVLAGLLPSPAAAQRPNSRRAQGPPIRVPALPLELEPGPAPQGAAPSDADSAPHATPLRPDSSGAPVDTLSLDEAVRIALDRSPAIREAQGSRMAAHAGRWEGWGRLAPSLTLSSGFSRLNALQRTATDPITGGTVVLPDSLVASQRTFGTENVISARWTVFDGGQAYWDVRKANAEARAGDEAFDATRARVAADVELAYLNALEAVAFENARRVQLESAKELAVVASERFRVGEVPELDDLQARLAVSDGEVAVLEAESATDEARFKLFENLGLAPETRVALIEPSVPDSASLPGEDDLRRRALDESAELASLRESRKAAERGLDAERWWFLPQVTLGVDWVRTEFGNNHEAFTLQPRNQQTYYTLGLSWTPLDRRGGLVADRKRARADLYTAEGRLAAREASLAREVEVALGRLRRVRLLEEKSRLNLELARKQQEQARERYRLGLAPIVERLNAEALAADADRQAVAARYATLRVLAELERAAGIRLTGAASPSVASTGD
jgi:outer membrane protein